MTRARITVRGRVQMVGFRYYTVQEARRLGISGFVRNVPSGDVEILAEGDEGDLKEFLRSVKKGPPGARVSGIETDSEAAASKFSDFSIRY